MTATTQPTRYHAVAITLHWLIALGIVGLLVVGFVMGDVEDHALKFKLYQLHKSFGIMVLVLSLVRLGWRLTHRPPAMPPGSKKWEMAVAHGVHWGFYVLMIGMPLVGWLGVSASPMKMPLRIFNLFSLPLLPVFSGDTNPRATAEGLFEAHEVMAYIIIGLLALHLGAVVKHHIILRNDVLLRMTPKFMHGALRCIRGKDA